MLFYNARIFPVVGDVIPLGYIRTEGNRIAEIASGTPENISSEDIDCGGLTLMPGLIDSHSHLGFIGDGAGMEGDDVNEASDPVTPQLRAIDGINFTDGYFKDAQRCGVTCAVTGCGSTNPIGGTFAAVKTAGRYIDEMVVADCAVKFALGENPKSCYSDRDESPMTRMATAAVIREALYTAKRYMLDKAAAEEDDGDMPDFDMKSEALIPLLRGEVKAHFHCHRADDIMTAVRLAEEFELDYVLIHCTEGYLIADVLGEKKVCANVGPIICDRGKPELARLSVKNAAELYKHGVKISVCTDHPEVPLDYLAASAAFCVKAGLPREEAVRAITINAAEITGIESRVGSIEVGKDADMILVDGDILDVMTNVVMTVIDGKIVYRS